MSAAIQVAPRTRLLCWVVLLGGFAGLVPLQRGLDSTRGGAPDALNDLYLPSGETLRRLSLGHQGLLADIYWTRVVQYFGRKRMSHSTRFESLGSMLRITTDLDPHLLVAYRFGSIFLAEKPPGGAGKPEEALQLIRRGIVSNPDYWRLWQDLGFIYYWDLRDYESAARVLRVGAERPGAMVWMKVMAATIAAQGGEGGTSRMLWAEIYQHADNEQVRESALEHLAALEAQEDLKQLNMLLAKYLSQFGRPAKLFQDLVAAGYLRALPGDSSGAPYLIGADGRATLSPQSKIDFRLLQ